MDINTIPNIAPTKPSGTTTKNTSSAESHPMPSLRKADTVPVKTVDVPQEKIADAREAYIRKAAESYRASLYPVSDVRFTIFKNTAGEYITRFTSLRDGTVTQVPEPALISSYSRKSGGITPPVLQTNA